MQQVHKLIYDPKTKRWNAYDEKNYCDSLYQGDEICIRVENQFFPATIELDTQWYVSIDGIRFRLHPKQVYDAILIPF